MKKAAGQGESLQELQASFRQKKFAPVYLLYGEEDFLIEEALDSLVENAVDESTKSFNLDVVYGSETTAKDIISFAAAFPMMTERRVVIVRELEKLAAKDALLPYLGKPSASTILVLLAGRPDFRQKFYKNVKELATAVECKSLYESDLPQWISKRVEQKGKKISPEACQLMMSQVGGSLREIQNELDKLFLFIGSKKTLDADDVNTVIGMSKQYNIFELQKSIGQKNLARSLEILERMLEVGEYPVGMIVMLTRYFQKVWLLQELRPKMSSDFQLASSMNISPYFVREYIQASSTFTRAQIEHCFEVLLEADESLKSSAAETKVVMTLMIYRCINGELITQTA